MEPETKYIQAADKQKFADFCKHHLPYYAGLPTGNLYHYTTGNNLIEIIKSGELWTTQITCLNDTEEYIYAIKELQKRVKIRIAQTTEPVSLMFEVMDKQLSGEIERSRLAGVFVTCLSEKRDDLSQWRSYGRGEGGYTIGFDPKCLQKLAFETNNALLIKVRYDPDILLGDIIRWSEQFFMDGRGRAPSDKEWADEFVPFWLWYLSPFAPMLKHPKFSEEAEWRLIFNLRDDSAFQKFQYRQRSSMMTYHMPLRFEENGISKLPIKEIVVGPCRHKEISQVSVSNLLKANQYDEIPVNPTEIPYRDML